MITPEDLPPHGEMTELERHAAGAALLAQGLAFQHQDNQEAANELADKIVQMIRGQHELRQEADRMRREQSGRHRTRPIDNAVAAQLTSLAEFKVSGTLET